MSIKSHLLVEFNRNENTMEEKEKPIEVPHLFDILTGRCHRCGRKNPKNKEVCYIKKFK